MAAPSWMSGAAALALLLAACGNDAADKVPEAASEERDALHDAAEMIAAPTPTPPADPLPGATPDAGPPGP